MKRGEFTLQVLGKALKKLRASRNLTQKQLAQRTARYRGPESSKKLLESQISDFERGKSGPSFHSLASYLAACSHDGETVDFGILQTVVTSVLEPDEAAAVSCAGTEDLRWWTTAAGRGYAVARDANPPALFGDPARAFLVAAILPGIEAGFAYRMTRREAGFDVTTPQAGSIGWLAEYSPETLESLQVTEHVVRSPVGLAWFLEAAHPRVLETALRFVEMRRRPVS